MSDKWLPWYCCGDVWPTRAEAAKHADYHHTREQMIELLLNSAQETLCGLARNAENAATVRGLRVDLANAEAEREAMLAEFDEWRDKVAHRLRVRAAAESVARNPAGLNGSLADGQKPETD